MTGGAGRPSRGTVAVTYAISATGILATPLVLPILPEIATDLDVSRSTVGLVVAAASAPGVVVAPIIGLLADRYGRRTVVIPCLVIFGIGGLVAGTAPTFELLLLARLFQGIGSAGLINLAVVIIGDHFDGPERARMIGRNAVVLTLGLSIFPTIGGALADAWGWRAAFLPYGSAFLVAAAVTAVLPKVRPPEPPPLAEQVRTAGGYLRDRRVAAMAAAGFSVFILVFGVATTLPLHLDEEFAASALVRGLILALPAAGAGTVSLLMGRISARWRPWDVIPVGYAMIAVAYVGVPLSPAVALVAFPALAYGMGEGLTIVPLQDYATALAPQEHRGVVVAMWVSAVRAGQSVGPALAGAAIGAFGTEGTFVAGALFATVLAVVASSARPGLKLHDANHSRV